LHPPKASVARPPLVGEELLERRWSRHRWPHGGPSSRRCRFRGTKSITSGRHCLSALEHEQSALHLGLEDGDLHILVFGDLEGVEVVLVFFALASAATTRATAQQFSRVSASTFFESAALAAESAGCSLIILACSGVSFLGPAGAGVEPRLSRG